jgi:hypothetical protein
MARKEDGGRMIFRAKMEGRNGGGGEGEKRMDIYTKVTKSTTTIMDSSRGYQIMGIREERVIIRHQLLS